MAGETAASKNLDGLVALALGLAYLGLYVLTLCRTVFWYDSAEYVTAAVTLGIPHPPGYPLYTILGHMFTWLPLDPATAVNAMSATFAALAVALTYLVGRRLGLDRIPAVAGAATLGGGKLFWANAVVAEVYCPALAVVALLLYLLLRAREERRFGLVLLASFAAGLGLGIHFSIATLGLGLALLVWAFDATVERPGDLATLSERSEFRPRLRRSFAAAGMAFLGSLIFLYLPFRAAQKPALNFGDPSNLERFQWVVSGGTYKGWFLSEFDVVARTLSMMDAFVEQLHPAGAVLAVFGLFWLWKRRPLETVALLLMAAGNLGFFFRYEVHDLAVFFLPSTLILCCFVGAGVQALIAVISGLVTEQRSAAMRNLVRGSALVFAASLALGNYRAVDMSQFNETEKFIAAMVGTLPNDAIIINFTTPPEWKLDAVFGMYVQMVLEQRTDVEVVVPTARGVVESAMESGRPVYTYVPVAHFARQFELVPDGPIFRVRGPRNPAP